MEFDKRVKRIMDPELDKIRNLFIGAPPGYQPEPQNSGNRYSLVPTVMDSDPSVRYDTRTIPEVDFPIDPVTYEPQDEEQQEGDDPFYIPNQEQLENGGGAPYFPWDIRKIWVHDFTTKRPLKFDAVKDFFGNLPDRVRSFLDWWDLGIKSLFYRLDDGERSTMESLWNDFRPGFEFLLENGWFWDEDDPGDPRDPSVQSAPPIDSDISVAQLRNTFVECCTQMKGMISQLELGVLQPGQFKQELLRRFP